MRLLLILLVLSTHAVHAREIASQFNAEKQPYLIDKSITGTYFLSIHNLTRDVTINTPIKGKFYFRFFIAQSPIEGKMSVLAYSEIDGVATFNKDNTANYVSPNKTCALKFYFLPMELRVEQQGSCNMPIELGYEATGRYTKLEAF